MQLKSKIYINTNTIIVVDFKSFLILVDLPPVQKINIETPKLNGILYHVDLAHIYRIVHPRTKEYTFYSAVHGSISNTNNILGHKTNLNKFGKIEISLCILSDHNGVKLKVNNR